jgi:glycosyltransferase involved in cell wall biosynthesis
MAATILYVHHRAQVSGAARSLAGLIARLDDRWRAHVLSPAGPVVSLFAQAGAEVTTAPVSLFQHTWDNPYAGRKWLLLAREAASFGPHVIALERLLNAKRFSLVHLNDSPLVSAAAIAHRRQLPVVWHLRSALSTRGTVRPWLVRRALERWGDAAIAIDDDVAASFALRLPVEVVFNSVPTIVNPLGPTEARQRLGIPVGPATIGFIGNLRRVKGWPQLLEAARLLADERTHFVVVGGGIRPPSFFRTPYGRAVAAIGLAQDDETELRRAVNAAGLDGRFTFVPFTNSIDDIYPALDIVAFPNQGAGLGRPVLEAAAFGIPVVAAGSPIGAGILLPERTGLLLDRPTPEALATALARLVGDAGLREELGAAARLHALEAFDPEAAARRTAALYDRVLNSPR